MRFLKYRKATSVGNSGSPLYFLDTIENKAYAIGVHVGGYDTLMVNSAVPIDHHMKTNVYSISTPTTEETVLQEPRGKFGKPNLHHHQSEI